MSITDPVSAHPERAFQILDEPGVGVLVLDRDMQVAWVNAYVTDILSTSEEAILGCDAPRVLDTHLVPLLRERESARGLLATVRDGIEVPGLELPVQNARGEEQRFVYSSQKMEQEPFMGMWVLRMRDATGRKAGNASPLPGGCEDLRGVRALHRISRLIDTAGTPPAELFREVARVLQSGFSHPKRIGVRITHDDAVYTHRYRETPGKITADIRENRRRVGSIEVAYLSDPSPRPEDVFNTGEQYLLQVAADMLGRAIRRMNEESQIRESEERYRSFVQNFQGIAYQTRVDSEPVFFHGAVEAITGYTGGEFLTGTVRWDAIVHPDDRPRLQESAARLQAVTGFSTDQVYRVVRKDGTTRWVREFVQNICNEDGTPVLIQGTIQDVTSRKKTNEGLLSANRQLQVLNQIMGVSASSLSLDELLETSLSKTLDLLDFDMGLTYLLNPERTLALTRCHHAVPKRYLSRNRAIKVHHWPWNFVFIAGQPRYIELRSKPGTVEEEILSSLGVSALACIPILAESVVVGALFVGSKGRQGLEDEERHLLEAIGREIGSGVLRSMLHKRLEAAHRETNLYLDIMTHDIKNAGNVASLYCDLLIDMLEEDAAEYAKKLRESVRKSTGILQNVATIRRIHLEPPDLKPVHLSHVIRAELDRIPEADVSFEDSTAEVQADDLLPEIFTNLIDNAIKFGGPDARVMIRVEDCPDDDHTVVVTVEDTGPGIPDGMKETIFRRFQQGRSQGYGEGLGLYIVGTLVTRYGGRIWVEDRVPGRPDLGAAFRFTLREVVHTGTDEYDEYEE